MESRFAVGDPIIKLLCQLTKCKVKLEQTVRLSDLDVYEDPFLDIVVSKSSKTDYVSYYSVRVNRLLKLLIIEMKTDKSFSLNAIAQTIGYYNNVLPI